MSEYYSYYKHQPKTSKQIYSSNEAALTMKQSSIHEVQPPSLLQHPHRPFQTHRLPLPNHHPSLKFMARRRGSLIPAQTALRHPNPRNPVCRPEVRSRTSMLTAQPTTIPIWGEIVLVSMSGNPVLQASAMSRYPEATARSMTPSLRPLRLKLSPWLAPQSLPQFYSSFCFSPVIASLGSRNSQYSP